MTMAPHAPDSRSGSTWGVAEDGELEQEAMQDDLCISDIATLHDRSVSSIYNRLRYLALKRVDDDDPTIFRNVLTKIEKPDVEKKWGFSRSISM
jgi:hypothetical protein